MKLSKIALLPLISLTALALLSSAAQAEQIRVVNFASSNEKLSLWVDGKEVRVGIDPNKASTFAGVGVGRKNVVLFSDRLPPRPFTLETKIGKRYTLVPGWGKLPSHHSFRGEPERRCPGWTGQPAGLQRQPLEREYLAASGFW